MWPFFYLKAALSFLNLEYLSKLEGGGGFAKSLKGEREGCVVNHALWWVINCVCKYISFLIVLKA